jgi:hypothetical protein
LFAQEDAVRILEIQNTDVGLNGLLPVFERQPQLARDEDIMTIALENQQLRFSLLRLVAGMAESGLASIVESTSGVKTSLDRIEVRKVENPNGDFRYFCSPNQNLVLKVLDEYS